MISCPSEAKTRRALMLLTDQGSSGGRNIQVALKYKF
jgi:hypothetical protein